MFAPNQPFFIDSGPLFSAGAKLSIPPHQVNDSSLENQGTVDEKDLSIITSRGEDRKRQET